MARTNQQIIKGSKLMVFIDDQPIGFATSHSLSISTNMTEISTKDHGDFPSQVVQSLSWEVQAENLYSEAGESTYMTAMLSKTPVDLVFAEAANYNQTGLEKGVIDVTPEKEWSEGTVIASGKALISSFSINAPAGDNATMSVTFTGVGEFSTGE